MSIRRAASPNYTARKLTDRLMRGLTVLATLLAVVPLVIIIGYVLIKGGSSLNIPFFTQTYQAPVTLGDLGDAGIDPATGLPAVPEIDPVTGLPVVPTTVPDGTQPPAEQTPVAEPAAQGGVLHSIVGTLLITGLALLFALPVGLMAGIFLSEFPANPVATFVRFCCDVLSGAPSIIVGVVGYVLVVQRAGTYSGLAGAIALTFLMVPTITRTTEEILKLVPNATREAALAMGAPMWYSTFTVVIPAALSGIVTGVLLAFSRGAGETAPLLLTVGGSNVLSFNVRDQMDALPLRTYYFTNSPFPAEYNQAWGTAFVLTAMVLLVNVLVRLATRRRG
ncbi:MAG: phosphate ABC transporter permease PstA [Chloroflexales bacterium]|nr:phosphate ABC transporter permease PstA [Chloroflexales bacterium]